MHTKFEINWTKIKGGYQSGRKVIPHNFKSNLPLTRLQIENFIILYLKSVYILDFYFQQQNNKIFKRGFNVNAQEWKPSSRRTSVGNASVKDIPMLDVFLQRLDRHSTYNSDQTSPRGPSSTGEDQWLKKWKKNQTKNIKCGLYCLLLLLHIP